MIYKRIKELREDRDIKQAEIAKELDISQGNYSFIENGVANLKADDLVKLCKFYNVSADYILDLPENLEYPKR
ncbi:MAG: helix-turn-helix domain-containing protein [Eubacterium sp.]|nr:helix-turn-helix domain-containing protein [Eubacterium sp.]MDE6767018.1 helix-turn-helix domain-containing protein [Eubacterium sp.]